MSLEQRVSTQPGPARTLAGRKRPRGQVLVIFASAITLLLLMVAIVIDVSWLWSNALRVQRAADAAALAGAVTLPNDPNKGIGLALAEAKKNGYIPGGTTVVAPNQDPQNLHRMHVLITAPVQTFFMRLVGFPTVMVSRQSDAEYNLPVPMGSPQNYYGIGLFNAPTTTTTQGQPVQGNTGFDTADESITRSNNNQGNNLPDSQTWDNPTRAENDENNNPQYATEDTNGDLQVWRDFGLQNDIPTPGTSTNGNVTTTVALAINKVEVRLRDIHLTPTNTNNANTNCQVQIEVFWSGGAIPSQARWLTPITQTINSTSDQSFTIDVTGNANWAYNDFDNNDFEVRLTWQEGTGCGTTGNNGINRGVALDALQAQVTYTTTTTKVTENPPTPQPVKAPDGTVLAPQNFWGAMNSYGSPSIQGDAHMTGYATRKSATNGAYDPDNFYNYEVDIPNGASNGEVWIFDPGFCDVASNEGTGEYWTVSNSNTGGNGSSSKHPVSALYELWNTKDTLYDRSDDTMVNSSGTLFTRSYLYDPNLDGDNSDGYQGSPASCANQSWHKSPGTTNLGWWQLAGGLGPGTYRVHTTSESQSAGDDQSDSTGLNAFALWTKATGGTPRVHGLGSMEAYFPLPAHQTSTFYLAQIDKEYAGKWMDIDLWDPGDTGDLPADLSILMPTANNGYQKATFYYKSIQGTSIPSTFVCDQNSSPATQTIQTSDGNNSPYNGYWLRLCIKIDNLYAAPKPTGEPEGGWWKIQYSMGGNSNDDPSTDLTTWSVNIRGNPVHLVTG